MREVDFLLGYEHKVRELESICLLKLELEKRGYSVEVYNVGDENYKRGKKKIHAKVLVLPFGYGDDVLAYSTKQAVLFDKVINLQWEQVLTREQEVEVNSYKTPSGVLKEAVHIAWGEANRKRLVELAGLPATHVFSCGNITLDFLKRPLDRLYMSKEELCDQFNLDKSKELCLFISSFKAAFLDKESLAESAKKLGPSRIEEHDILWKSFNSIMVWVENYTKEHPNTIMIYRPHPGEIPEWNEDVTRLMNGLVEKYDNFYILGDLSVKQWIVAADKIIMGMTTAVSEVYQAGKQGIFLYPDKLPYNLEGPMFDNARFVADEEGFKEAMENGNGEFPIPKADMEAYYNDFENMCYMKVCDVCEEVFKDDKYCLRKESLDHIYNYQVSGMKAKEKLAYSLEQDGLIHNLQNIYYKLNKKNKKCQRKLQELADDNARYAKEVASKEEIDGLVKKFSDCLEG